MPRGVVPKIFLSKSFAKHSAKKTHDFCINNIISTTFIRTIDMPILCSKLGTKRLPLKSTMRRRIALGILVPTSFTTICCAKIAWYIWVGKSIVGRCAKCSYSPKRSKTRCASFWGNTHNSMKSTIIFRRSWGVASMRRISTCMITKMKR